MNVALPLVSVITPTHNSSKYIIDTIISIKNQTLEEWELIVVDDCSTDSTIKLVEKEMELDSRIILMKNLSNLGAANSRNRGIRESKGRYIAFLDSDDLWVPDKLKNQVKFMQNNDIAFSFTSYEMIDEEGKKLNKEIKIPKTINYDQLLKNTIIGCLTVMLDKKKLKDIEMPNIRTRQDTALWLKILKTGEVAYGLDNCLAQYRKVSNSLSSNKFKMAYKTWRMYRDIEKLSFLKSMYVFLHYTYNSFKKHSL